MGDSKPSTSGRAEKERQAIGGMWVYVQPMSMYNHIQQRQQAQGLFLRRNLSYHKPKNFFSADRYTEMCIQLDSAGGQPLFVVLCKKVAQSRKSLMAFEPLSVQLSDVQLSDASEASQKDTHTLQFQIPHQHQHSQLGILAIASNDASLSHIIGAFKLRKGPGSSSSTGCSTTSRLTKDCTTRVAFGVIPNGSDVYWQFAPLPTSWPPSSAAHAHAESVPPVHAKMQRRRGTLQMALSRTGCVLQLSNQTSGAFLGVCFSLRHHIAFRPASASASCSADDGRAADGATGSQTDRSDSHCAASIPAPNSQKSDEEWGRVRFRYHFHIGQRRFHCIEATSNFACFACSQTCKGLLGLQQHIEASHDLFNFSYPKAEPEGKGPTGGGSLPTIIVGCPDNLFDQHGNLQTLETDDLESVDGKEMGFFCPKRLRRLRLDQYSMTEQQRRGLDAQLTHNKFRKSAWKLWHDSGSAAAVTNRAAQSAAPSDQSPPALPMRPFSAQPRHSETQARAASHAAASTSSSGNLAAGQKRPAGSADADADASGGGSAKLGKPPQPQAPPRKRPRLQPHPPSVHDVTGPPPVYFHARSCTRMTPQEVTRILQDPHAVPDSDDEEDQAQWKERAARQLDNQTDLSAAERDLMLRWNLYLHDHPCLSDAQMSQRCRDFATVAAKDMQRDPDLQRCFLVHLINLWEFNLVPAAIVDECMACIMMRN